MNQLESQIRDLQKSIHRQRLAIYLMFLALVGLTTIAAVNQPSDAQFNRVKCKNLICEELRVQTGESDDGASIALSASNEFAVIEAEGRKGGKKDGSFYMQAGSGASFLRVETSGNSGCGLRSSRTSNGLLVFDTVQRIPASLSASEEPKFKLEAEWDVASAWPKCELRKSLVGHWSSDKGFDFYFNGDSLVCVMLGDSPQTLTLKIKDFSEAEGFVRFQVLEEGNATSKASARMEILLSPDRKSFAETTAAGLSKVKRRWIRVDAKTSP
jgi:hypothetical protein